MAQWVDLVPGIDLYDLCSRGRAKICDAGCELDHAKLPFKVHPHSTQLPAGKVSFYLLSTGEYEVLAGGHGGTPLQHFAAIPSYG